MRMKNVLATIFILIAAAVDGKIYDRCELARELVEKHEAPEHQVATWVCIAQHESQFNTSAVGQMNGDNSKDHGIFQISDLFWCSPPGNGWACGVTCAELEDDDIEDDFICARRIYREHKLLSGDGFNAWVVYHTHCSGNVKSYISGCFNDTQSTPTSQRNDIEKDSTPSSTTQRTNLKKESSSPATEKSSASTATTTIEVSSSTPSIIINSLVKGRDEGKPKWYQWFTRFRWP